MKKTKLTLLLLAALLVGVCLGFLGNRAVIQARIRHFSRIPGNVPAHITDMLAKRLELDAEQQNQVRAIVQSYDARLQKAREDSRATFEGIMQEMRTEVAAHLTPAQQAEHEKLIVEIDQRRQENRALRQAMHLPPPGMGNPAPAPSK